MTETTAHDGPVRSIPEHAHARELLDCLFEGCQIISFEFRYLYLNDVAARQARQARSTLIGKLMWDCFPGIERTPMFATLRRCMAERVSEQMENEFEFPDGTRLVFGLHFVPVAQGVCVLSLDLTARQHQLAAIVHDSDDAIVSRSLDGVITSWNRGAERAFGYLAHEMIGSRHERLFMPGESGPGAWDNERLAAGERIPSFEAALRHKDGRPIDVSITLSPVRDQAGALVGVSMIARDVTAFKRVQRELVRAKDAAEAANHELEAFAYSVAHDLRAPLRRISAFTEALGEDLADKLDPSTYKHLDAIRGSTRLMASLIDDILKLSRLTRTELELTAVDLSTLARTAIARLQLGEPARRVDAQIAEGLTAQGNPRLLAVVLDNLLGNAWKFTARRAHAKIEVGCAEIRGAPTFFVRDNGVGFDMAYASQLFLPFHRLHAAEQFEGTGVGLATVQRIIHRHGGRVWAEGEVGQGAAFYFVLGD